LSKRPCRLEAQWFVLRAIEKEKVMAGRIVVTEYMSLDGVIEDPVGMEGSGLGDWTGPYRRGPEGDRFKLEELRAASALLFGRGTYDAFAAVWPSVHDEAGYADRMNSLPKYLASSRPSDAPWADTTVLSGDVVEAVRTLKQRIEGEILVFGSLSVVRQLAPHGLIDEYRLMIYPTILGRGGRLFAEGAHAKLSLIEQRQFGDGIVLLSYRAA
jgi:dihydrofolate reductase